MIKNQRQRQQTQKRIDEFRSAVRTFKSDVIPEGIHPIMHQANLDGMASMLVTLEREATEYDILASGTVQSISVENLDGLPEGLIKARIAKGLTQKELSNRIGVTAQQVQRWEFEDYHSVGFARMVDIAHALEVSISETIMLNTSIVRSNLEGLGIDSNFLKKRLVPSNDNSLSGQSQIVLAAGRLSRIFGIDLSPDGEVSHAGLLAEAGGSLRFKLPANGDAKRTRAYAAYVEYLCKAVAQAFDGPPAAPVTRDWRSLSALLFKNERVDFSTALRSTWEMGIPVLPLSDSIRFHGCCFRANSRNVVVLKQSIRQPSRWLFDLVHELYHAGESPGEATLSKLAVDPTDVSRRQSDDEKEANEFAGNVLLSGQASELYSAVLTHANHVPARLKKSTVAVAAKHEVDVGILANYVAFRLKSDQLIDWWGAATNLQPEGDDPYGLARDALLRSIDVGKLSEDDQLLINQSLVEIIT